MSRHRSFGRWFSAAASALILFQAVASESLVVAATPSPTPQASASKGSDPTDVPELRTANSVTVDNHDGTFTSHISPGPINYQAAGQTAWQPIAVGFAPVTAKDGQTALSDKAPASIGVAPANSANGFLRLTAKGVSVAFRLPPSAAATASVSAPTTSGAVADYPNALPGTDLRVVAGAMGARSWFIWKAAPTDPTVSFVVDAPGLKLAAQADGSIALVSAKGDTVASIPAPYVVDSTVAQGAGSGAFSNAVNQTVGADGVTVSVAVDPTWLKSATYPVYIDPTVTLSSTSVVGDAHVSSAYPTTNFADYQRPDSPYYHELWLGDDPGGLSGTNQVYLRIDVAAYAGVAVDSATLQFFPYHQYYSAPTQVTMTYSRVTASWTESGITWNNKPVANTTGTINTVEGTTATIDVTASVQAWTGGTGSNYGWRFSEPSGVTYWKRLISSEQGGANVPALVLTYHRPTATIVSPTSWTNNRLLTWSYSDPLGQAQTAYQVDVATDTGFTNLVPNGSVSGTGTATSWTIPDTALLTDGTTYYWRVKVKNTAGWSTYATSPFMWDSSAPVLGFTSPPSGTTIQPGRLVAVNWTEGSGAPIVTRSLQRQKATLTGSTCGTSWSNDGAADTTSPPPVAQFVANNACYQWTQTVTDAAGNSAGPITSGVIGRDSSSALGQQDQISYESWDLGAGDNLVVNVASGNLMITHPLVTLPIRGSSTSIGLTYNALDASDVGMSPGWRLNVHRRLTLNADNTVTVTDSDGARYTFTNPTTIGTVTSYTRPQAFYATLVKDTSQTVEFTLTDKDQSRDTFDISGTSGLLTRIEDRHGNGMTVSYVSGTSRISKLTDSASRTIDFAYDGSNHLVSVTDWAYLDANGVVQTTNTGTRRATRFFYDGGGILIGWADPLNTSGACPTAASHRTCLTYTSGVPTGIAKTQTQETLTGSTLGTATRMITTAIGFTNGDVTSVTDAEQNAISGPATAFVTQNSPAAVSVSRPGTPVSTTAYGLVATTDPYLRTQSVWRTWSTGAIETRTAYDTTYLTLPASVTQNSGALFLTPARTISTTYAASSLGNVSRTVEPLTASTNRWTDYVYNTNNDVTQKTVSLDGSTTNRTITRYCYDGTCSLTGAGLDLLNEIDNYVSGGNQNADTNVTTDFSYDAYGERIRTTRHNRSGSGAGTVLDDRADGGVYDSTGNLTSSITNYVDGVVGGSGQDVTPDANSVRTDLTSTYGLDTAGNRVSTADPRRSILLATTGTTYALDNFNRTIASGWGIAPTGGTWTGTTSAESVNGSAGLITLTAPNDENPILPIVAGDQELLVRFNVNQIAAGGDTFVWFRIRYQDSSNFYEARVKLKSLTGLPLDLEFGRTSAGTATTIASFRTAESQSTSTWYWLRADLTGTTSVTLKARLWRDQTTEPTGWQLSGTDASAPANLQGTGKLSVRFQATGTGTYPVTASYDDLSITSVGASGSVAASDYLTTSTFDGLGQEVSAVSPTTPGVTGGGQTATTTYDELGGNRESTTYSGLLTATEYDRESRGTRNFERPSGSSTASVTSITTFDVAGRTIKRYDREQAVGGSQGGWTESTYDSVGQVTAVTDAKSSSPDVHSETDTSFDALGRETSGTIGAPSSQVTITTYDLGGHTLTVDDGFACTSSTYDYRDLVLTDTTGLVGGTCATGGDTRTTTSTYDGLGRPTRVEVTAGIGNGDRTLDDSLDSVGNHLTSGTRTGGIQSSSTININKLDEVITTSRPDTTTAKSTFDAMGNIQDQCDWASGLTVGNCYEVGHPGWINPPASATTSTTYDAMNQRIVLVEGVPGSTDNQTTTLYDPTHNYEISDFYIPTASGLEAQTLYAYDNRDRLTNVKAQVCTVTTAHNCSGTPPVTGQTTYTYDDNNNRTEVNENNGGASTDYFYCYDALNQLTSRGASSTCSSPTETNTYDAAGNRTQAVAGGMTTNYQYSAAGQLCRINGTNCATGGSAVIYDSAGRMSAYGNWTYYYDSSSRLIRACHGSTCTGSIDKVEYAYDGQGHRTQIKTTSSAGVVSTTDFAYQGDAIVAEKLTDPTHAAPGVVVRTYVVDPSGAVVKMTIAAGEPGAGTYLVTWNGHGDALNLQQVQTDGTLKLANAYTYSTWGTPTTTSYNSIADVGFRFLYVGQQDVQWDNQFGVGLYYMHARHYFPSVGRFIQPDPSGVENNLYEYTADSPVGRSDPSGQIWCLAGLLLDGFGVFGTCAVELLQVTVVVVGSVLISKVTSEVLQKAARTCFWSCHITVQVPGETVLPRDWKAETGTPLPWWEAHRGGPRGLPPFRLPSQCRARTRRILCGVAILTFGVVITKSNIWRQNRAQ